MGCASIFYVILDGTGKCTVLTATTVSRLHNDFTQSDFDMSCR